MREVQIIVHCDVCDAYLGDDRKPVPPLDLGDGYRELDLCEAHIAALWTPLHDVYFDAPKSQSGTPPAKQSSRPEALVGVECPLDGCGHVFRSRSSARLHLAREHQTTIGAEQERLGHGLTGAPIKYRCDDCKEAYVTGQEFGQHNKNTHPRE